MSLSGAQDAPVVGTEYTASAAVLEALGTAALLLDAADRVVYVTPAAAALLGLAAPDLAGQAWPRLWATLASAPVVLTGEPQRVTVRRAGQDVPLRAWCRPLPDSHVSLVALEDLSAEDEREREVLHIFQDSQEQADDLFALYQITQFLSTAQELDQLCTTFLRELERMAGADLACLYLATPAGLAPKVWHGLPVPAPQPDSAAAEAWLRGQAPGLAVMALPLLDKDRPIGLALLAHSGLSARQVRFLHTVAREMGTALQAMAGRQVLLLQEQKLEAIVLGTTDAIIQVGSEGLVGDFNPAAAQITGYAVAEALGRSCGEILGCTTQAGCAGACPFARVLATREPIPYTEMIVQGRTGPRQVAASVAALDLGPQAPPAAVAIVRDMTQVKQIEQMKGDFLVMVSHQLRTPLALLRGYTDTLLHLDLSPQEQRTCVEGIAGTTERLAHLVQQILEVTRIEDGRLELHCEPVRLVDVIRRAITGLPRAAHPSRIWAELAPGLPLVWADPQRLEEVVINVLDNALKYSPPSAPVQIQACADGATVRVEIQDQGIGIPPEEHEFLFRKFQRAANARQLQIPGTGLGLFICRSIVEAHGGRIALESAPARGTRIAIWLPIAGAGAQG